MTSFMITIYLKVGWVFVLHNVCCQEWGSNFRIQTISFAFNPVAKGAASLRENVSVEFIDIDAEGKVIIFFVHFLRASLILSLISFYGFLIAFINHLWSFPFSLFIDCDVHVYQIFFPPFLSFLWFSPWKVLFTIICMAPEIYFPHLPLIQLKKVPTLIAYVKMLATKLLISILKVSMYSDFFH